MARAHQREKKGEKQQIMGLESGFNKELEARDVTYGYVQGIFYVNLNITIKLL